MIIADLIKTSIVINGKGNLINGKALKNVHPGFLSFGRAGFSTFILPLNFSILEHLIDLSFLFLPFRSSIKKNIICINQRDFPSEGIQAESNKYPIPTLEFFITFSIRLDPDLQKN